jgi:xylulokinase
MNKSMQRITTLCIDIGTSSIKGGIIDGRGAMHRWKRFPLKNTETAGVGSTGPLSVISIVKKLISSLAPLDDIHGVSISGNGPTLVPVDSSNNPVASTLLWNDGNKIGFPGQPSYYLPKARWFMKNNPESYAKTRHFLSYEALVNRALTGEAAFVIPSPSFAQYLWTDDSISAFGLSAGLFPPLVITGSRIGAINLSGSLEFGLPLGVPVFGGGLDFIMSLLGTAAVRAGRTCDRAGTSEGINYCSDTAVDSPGLLALPHAIPGLYNVAGILPFTGLAFEWFRSFSGSDDYTSMLESISAVGHLPNGPFFFPSLAAKAPWKFTKSAFWGLDPDHGYAEMGRAVVESIGFAVREKIDELEQNGCVVEELLVSGGQALSKVWNQMKADITGKRVQIPRIVDAELTGNSAAAMTGLGAFPDLIDAAESLVSFTGTYEPRPREFDLFSRQYEAYRETRSELADQPSDLLNKPRR